MTNTDNHADPAPPNDLPLHGIRVLDLSRALSGPYCTTLLGDLGANVIKVEPLNGDMIREWGPLVRGTSLYHVSVNRNKRSIALDLRSEPGRATLHRMVRQSDVVVENFRSGVMDALGLSQEWLAHHAPATLVTSVSGFGTRGPLRMDPCFDQIAQGMAGLMSVTGKPNEPELRVGVPIADILTGMFTAIGIAAALAGRARGGSTSRVETSMLESVMSVLTFQAQGYLSTGEVPHRAGNAHPVLVPYGAFATADRPINIAAGTQAQFARLCAVLDRPELARDPRFIDGPSRLANRPALGEIIEVALGDATAEQWLVLLRGASVPAGPVHDMAGMFADPQVRALEMVQRAEHPDLGEVDMLRGPFHVHDVPSPVRRVAPRLGEHGTEVLHEFGFDDQEILQLARSGILVGEHVEAGS